MTSKFNTSSASSTNKAARKPRVKRTIVEGTRDNCVDAGLIAADVSSRRLMVATVVSLAVAAVGGYAAAWLAATASVAALALTGSAFLTIMVWLLAAVIGLLAALKTSNAAFAAVIEFDGSCIPSFFGRACDQVAYTSSVLAYRVRAAGRALVTPEVVRHSGV